MGKQHKTEDKKKEKFVQNSSQRASELLAQWNIRLEDLKTYIRPLEPSETLLLVGSVADGLANPYSDIDLLMIGDGKLEQGFIQTETEFNEATERLPGGQEINPQYWQTSTLELLRERLNSTFDMIQSPIQSEKLNRLTDTEIRVLHRIRTCIVLANPEIASEWQSSLRVSELPDYRLLHEIGKHFVYREDAIAQVLYGEPLLALSMLRFSTESLVNAALASVGETNPDPKWQIRLLMRNKEIIGEERINEVLRFLFPSSQGDPKELINDGLPFFDLMINETLARRPNVIPAMMELNRRVSFVKNF